MKDIKLKVGETIIPIESLKAVELSPNDTLIIETEYNLSCEAKEKIEDAISDKVCGKVLVVPCGFITKAVIKGVAK